MARMQLSDDVRPLSEFRSHFAAFIKQVRQTKRPMVITQRGRSAAVLLDVGQYEAMLSKLEVIEDIQRAEAQLGQGLGVEHEAAKAGILEGLKG